MKAVLLSPQNDKNYRIQFTNVDQEFKNKIIALLNPQFERPEEITDAKPFIQGNSEDWLLVEFWSKGKLNILVFLDYIQSEMNIEIENTVLTF